MSRLTIQVYRLRDKEEFDNQRFDDGFEYRSAEIK